MVFCAFMITNFVAQCNNYVVNLIDNHLWLCVDQILNYVETFNFFSPRTEIMN